MPVITERSVIRSEQVVDQTIRSSRPELPAILTLSDSVLTASSEAYQNYWGYTLNQITPGFKRKKVYMTWDATANTVDLADYPLYVPGAAITSNRSYDLYSQNPAAYFYVQTQTGDKVLTRDGRLIRSPQTGHLVTIAGNYKLLDESGQPIQLGTDRFRVTPAGEIYQADAPRATLALVTPINLTEMRYINGMIMGISPERIRLVPTANRLIRQGAYEAAVTPKGLKVDDHGVFKYIYTGTSHVAKRSVQLMKSTVRLNTN